MSAIQTEQRDNPIEQPVCDPNHKIAIIDHVFQTAESRQPNQGNENCPLNMHQQLPFEPDYNSVAQHSLMFNFGNGELTLQLRRKSLKVKMVINDEITNEANSINQNSIVLILSDNFLTNSIRQIYGTFQNLYGYLYYNIRDAQRVTITSDEITILSPQVINGNQLTNHLSFNLKQLRNDFLKSSSNINVDLSNMEDHLFQFSSNQLQFIQEISNYLENNPIPLEGMKYTSILEQLKLGLEDQDEEGFLEIWEQQNQDPFNESALQSEINTSTKSIQEFQEKYGQFLSKIPNWSAPRTAADSKIPFSRPTIEPYKRDPIFPPHYIPPAKLSVPGAPLSANEQIKMQAITSKREKLKMAKQWLRQGLSTSQVIQRLQVHDRVSKAQKSNPMAGKTIEPVKINSANGKLPQQPITPSRSSNQSISTQSGGNNERQVRQMLIALLKEKRYKKLDEIQTHMANAGLQTSVVILKKMIDEIRAKSAQRRNQQSTIPKTDP